MGGLSLELRAIVARVGCGTACVSLINQRRILQHTLTLPAHVGALVSPTGSQILTRQPPPFLLRQSNKHSLCRYVGHYHYCLILEVELEALPDSILLI